MSEFDSVLVTGGCGFIGSHFIKEFSKNNPKTKIFNLDKLTYAGRKENLIELKRNKNYFFKKGDICSKKVVDSLMKKCDAVIHFAAESHVDRSIVDPISFLKTNVFGTGVLLESAKGNNIQKFIHISTDEVYGDKEKGSSFESDELIPSSPYSASKAAGDRLAHSYFHTYDLPVVIHRGANNFGPNQFPEKLIPLFIINLLRNKKVPLYGDGMQKRDWLYVKDNVKSIELLLKKGENGEVYNVGAGNIKTNLEITQFILRTLGKSNSMIEKVEDRLGHDRRYCLNFEKISKLGWSPSKNLEAQFTKTIEW